MSLSMHCCIKCQESVDGDEEASNDLEEELVRLLAPYPRVCGVRVAKFMYKHRNMIKVGCC